MIDEHRTLEIYGYTSDELKPQSNKLIVAVCEECGNLQAHHIEPIRDNRNNLSLLDINNGITLCKDCHLSVNWREDEFVDYFVAIIGGDSIV